MMKKQRYFNQRLWPVVAQGCLLIILLSSGATFPGQNKPLAIAQHLEVSAANTNLYNTPVYYVRSGANGAQDGSSWASAWTELPNPLERGAIYYLADGEYPDYIFDDAEDGEKRIIIKKATKTEHGDSESWDESYGDGQAIFHTLVIETGYWVIDGSYRASKDSGHGIKVVIPGDKGATTAENGIKVVDNSSHPRINNITIKYIEFTSLIGNYPTGTNWVAKNGYEHTDGGDNIYIGYCYFHHLIGPMQRMRMQNGAIIEHNYYWDNKSYADGPHGDAIQLWGTPDSSIYSKNSVIRYNEFRDIEGTAFINLAWGISNLHIYGNIFYYSPGAPQIGVGGGLASPYDGDVGPLYIYNNTLAHSPNSRMYIAMRENANLIGSEHYVYNNLWFNCTDNNAAGVDGFAHEGYNYISQSKLLWTYSPSTTTQITDVDPFIKASENNFHLQTDLPGRDLSQESWWDTRYDSLLDADGKTRGGDGGWDIGAYEFTPELDLRGTPGNQSIYLDWTVNISLPVTTTWLIDYYTQTTSLPFTVTDPLSTTRSTVLTENVVNYQWYTVTLYAMPDKWLSDTVRVMPTDRFVYLPIIIR